MFAITAVTNFVDVRREWRTGYAVCGQEMTAAAQGKSERVDVRLGIDASQLSLLDQVGRDRSRCLAEDRDAASWSCAPESCAQLVAENDERDDRGRNRPEQRGQRGGEAAKRPPTRSRSPSNQCGGEDNPRAGPRVDAVHFRAICEVRPLRCMRIRATATVFAAPLSFSTAPGTGA